MTDQFPIAPRCVATAAVSRDMEASEEFSEFVKVCLRRFYRGDDGDLDDDDKAVNRRAAVDGTRILASYKVPEHIKPLKPGIGDDKLWIITDAAVDGQWFSTTVLWPSDY